MGKKILQGNLDIEGSLWLSGDVKVGGTAEDKSDAKALATEEYVDNAIGSGAEVTPIIKNDLDFSYDPETDTWDFDPTLIYTGTGNIQLDCGGYMHFASLSNWTLTGYGSIKAQRIQRSENMYSICLNVKQTILDNFNNIEHYRVYSYDATETDGELSVHANGWSKWFSNLPWPRSNASASDYWATSDSLLFPILGMDYRNHTAPTGLSQSDTCTIDAQDLINYWTGKYADNALVHYNKSQPLTDEQKAQARANIGTISVEISETPKDGEILVYDAATNKLVNSGYTFESLKTWIQQQINNMILNGEW